jgi:hypothetical protein
MRGYFGLGQLSSEEKSDILNQHKSVYNGYQTMQPQVSNTQPLYVYDDISDKDGFVVNNKGEVKKYTNMGINEQVESKEVCDECGSMIMDGVCECNYGHMDEELDEELDENMCECGGEMYEGMCNECGSGYMEEATGHLDDIYKVKDLNLKKGDFDYVEGGGNDYGTFEGMHKKLYKEDREDMLSSIINSLTDEDEDDGFQDVEDFEPADEFMTDDDDFEDYESSYTEDGVEDPDNEDDGFEDLNASEVTDGEMDEQGFTGGGNAPDMDVSNVKRPYNFESGGPNTGYPVFEDDMYSYDPEKMYETMESAWADEELEVEMDEEMDEELDEQPDISGVQGIYGDMEKPYDFDSNGPGIGGPYQHSSWGGGSTHSPERDEEFEEVDEDLKESFLAQKNKINEMFNRFKRYN